MLYQIKRNGTTIFEHEIKGVCTKSAPAVDFIDVDFDYYEAILLERNDTIEFNNQVYYCDKQFFNVFKKGANSYSHRARFLSENYRATEIAVLDAQGVSEFEIEGNLLTLLTLAVTNLNRISSDWSYELPVPTTVTKKFVISEENVMSFLTKVSGEFEIPFEIKNKVIKFSTITHINKGDFAYGRGNGFLDLKKSYKNNEKVPNTIYATGGEGLTIDPIINQQDIDKNGVIEGFYKNEDIVPTTRIQVIGSTSYEYIATTNQINYDLNDYKIAGQTPIINFETGSLAGLSFFIYKFDFNEIGNVSLIYFKKSFIDGVEYPNNNARPNNGDYFNITGISQPQEVVDEAKNRLLSEATNFLLNNLNKNLIVEANLDPLYSDDLEINNRIKIVDSNLDIDGFFIINEIKQYLQDLQRKEITLDYIGRSLFSFKLPIKGTDIIDLNINNNYDELVKLDKKYEIMRVDFNNIETDVISIKTIDLPSKQPNLRSKFVKANLNSQFIEITANENIVNTSGLSDISISSGFSDGNLLVVNATSLEQTNISINYIDKESNEHNSIQTEGATSLKFIWSAEDLKWIDIT